MLLEVLVEVEVDVLLEVLVEVLLEVLVDVDVDVDVLVDVLVLELVEVDLDVLVLVLVDDDVDVLVEVLVEELNCSDCNSILLEAIKAHRLGQSNLKGLDCSCKPRWKILKDQSSYRRNGAEPHGYRRGFGNGRRF